MERALEREVSAPSRLTRRDLEIAQQDWTKIEPALERAAVLLYERLFVLDASLRVLFGPDVAEQGRKMMRMIGAAAHGLGQPEVFVPIVRHLGRKHGGLGLEPAHYAALGAALLWTLEQVFGPGFGPEHTQAWTNVFETLAEVMETG
jgi:nitric oxide dioxygenase